MQGKVILASSIGRKCYHLHILIAECRSKNHEALSSSLEAESMKCLENWEENALRRFIFLRRGSEKINGLRNYLGCSAEINKEPDASIRVLHAETKKVLSQPSLVVEVESSNVRIKVKVSGFRIKVHISRHPWIEIIQFEVGVQDEIRFQ